MMLSAIYQYANKVKASPLIGRNSQCMSGGNSNMESRLLELPSDASDEEVHRLLLWFQRATERGATGKPLLSGCGVLE